MGSWTSAFTIGMQPLLEFQEMPAITTRPDHGDHEGHDHGDHDHAHGNELSLEGMTDAQILEIQEALLAELGALQALFDSIGSAVPEAVNE